MESRRLAKNSPERRWTATDIIVMLSILWIGAYVLIVMISLWNCQVPSWLQWAENITRPGYKIAGKALDMCPTANDESGEIPELPDDIPKTDFDINMTPVNLENGEFTLKVIPIWPGVKIGFSNIEFAMLQLKNKNLRTEYANKLMRGFLYNVTNKVRTVPNSEGGLDPIQLEHPLEGNVYCAWQKAIENGLEVASITSWIYIPLESEVDFSADYGCEVPEGGGEIPDGSDIPNPPPDDDGWDGGGGASDDDNTAATETPEPTQVPTEPTPTLSEMGMLKSQVAHFVGSDAATTAYTGGDGAWFAFEQIGFSDLVNIQGAIAEMLVELSPKGVNLFPNNSGQWWAITVSQERSIPLIAVKLSYPGDKVAVPGENYHLDFIRWNKVEVRWVSGGNGAQWRQTSDGSYQLPFGASYVWPCRPSQPTPTSFQTPTPQAPAHIAATAAAIIESTPTSPPPTQPWIPGGGSLGNLINDYQESGLAQWDCASAGKDASGQAKLVCKGVEYTLYPHPSNIQLLADTVYVADHEVCCFVCAELVPGEFYVCPAK